MSTLLFRFVEDPSARLRGPAFAAVLTLVGLSVAACEIDIGIDAGGSDGSVASDSASDADGDGSDRPSYDRRLTLPGLSAPVTARYDTDGVLHLDCQTAVDCYTAQGYLHARDRFFQMDIARHQARGRLGEMFGLNLTLDRSDRFYRKIMTTRDGRRLERAVFEGLDQQTRSMFQSYARGVNAWLADHRNGENDTKLAEEYEFPVLSGYEIPDWKPIDTVAVYLSMTLNFGMFSGWDARRGRAVAAMPADLANDTITLRRPGISSSIIPTATTNQASDGDFVSGRRPGGRLPDGLRRRMGRHAELFGDAARASRVESLLFGRPGGSASNNWAVAPSRTDGDVSFFASDPHLTMTNPSIWYFVDLQVDGEGNPGDGFHATGASVPATPGVVVGHNETIAWGPTIAMFDLADAYRETLTPDGERVIRNGQEIEIVEKTFTFPGKNGNEKEVDLEWVPGHGPIMEKDVDAQSAVTYKWVGQDPSKGPEFLSDLLRAETVEEAGEALEPIRALNMNWVVADTNGNIGWFPVSDVPDRSGWASASTPPSLPLPGDGSAEWDGYLDDSKIPELVNPSAGFVATANNDFFGAFDDGNPYNDDNPLLQSIVQYGHRHAAIVEGLTGSSDHDLESMRRLQAKTESLHARKVLPEILNRVSGAEDRLSPVGTSVLQALKAWNYTCPTGLEGSDPSEAAPVSDETERVESVGCTAFHATLAFLTRGVFEDELEGISAYSVRRNWAFTNNKYGLQDTMISLLTEPSVLAGGESYFDDTTTSQTTETAEDIVVEALDDAGNWLKSEFGSASRGDWRWGRTHVAVFESLVASFGTDTYDNGPYANDGGFLTLDVGNPIRSKKMTFEHHRSGSYRMIVRLEQGGEIDGWFQLPGGNVHHRDSQFYDNLLSDWLENESTPMRTDSSAVRDSTARSIRLEREN